MSANDIKQDVLIPPTRFSRERKRWANLSGSSILAPNLPLVTAMSPMRRPRLDLFLGSVAIKFSCTSNGCDFHLAAFPISRLVECRLSLKLHGRSAYAENIRCPPLGACEMSKTVSIPARPTSPHRSPQQRRFETRLHPSPCTSNTGRGW